MSKQKIFTVLLCVLILVSYLSTAAMAQFATDPWSVPLTISGTNNYDLVFGTHPDASDAYEDGIDVWTPPVGPPQSDYHTYFEISTFPTYLSSDFRSSTEQTHSWTLKINALEGVTSTLTWDASSFPTGSYPIPGSLMIVELNVDMLTENSVDVTGAQSLTIEYHAPTHAVTQTITIKHGMLNMISFNIQPQDLAVDILLDDLETLLIAQDDDGNFYIPPYGVNTISNVDLTNGYQVYITGSADDNVVNEGDPLVPQDYSQALNNTKLFMICYPYQNPHPVVDVFASITSSVVVVQDDEGRFWIPIYGVNTMGDMQPGKGYQIYVNQTVNFTYPALAGCLAKTTKPVAELPEPSHFQFQRTGLPYGIVVTGSEDGLAVGDEVGVFTGELCVGASVFTGDYPLVIAAWEGHEEYGLNGFKAGQTISLRVWKISESREVEVAGHFATVTESVFCGMPISAVSLGASISPEAIPINFALDQNYPNPFNVETIIYYDVGQGVGDPVEVSLCIYNSLGQMVRTLVQGRQTPGQYSVLWDGKDDVGEAVSSGIYVYRLMAGHHLFLNKMVFLK